MSRTRMRTATVLTACSAMVLVLTGSPARADPVAGGSRVSPPCPAAIAPPPAPTPATGRVPDRLYAVLNHLAPGAPTGTPALVDVIDPVTNRVVSSVPVGPEPHHIYVVPGTGEAYVTHFGGCSMEVLDLATSRVIGQVRTGPGPRHLSFSPGGRFAYVVDDNGSAVTVINTRNNRTLHTIPTGGQPNYSLTSPDGRLLYVVNSGSGTLTVALAQPPFQVLRTLKVGKQPFNLALAERGRTLVVTNAGDDTVSLIRTATLQVTATIPIRTRKRPTPAGQKLNVRVDGRYAWVGDQQGAAFAVIDLLTRRLATVLPAASGADIFTPITKGPLAGIAITTARYGTYLDVVDPRHPRLLATVSTAPSLAPKDPASYRGLTGPVGVGSHMLVTNISGTRAYISDRPGGAVTVLDLTSRIPTLLTDIATSYGRYGFPDGLAYVHLQNGVAAT